MSLFSRFRKLPKRIYTDKELKQLSDNDGYWRGKIIRDVAMYIVCVLFAALAIALMYQYIIDQSFRSFILEQIKQNFIAIIFFVLALLGIKVTSSKKDL